MLKLSKLTDYATVILTYMAKNASQMEASQEISSATGVALPTVSKILKILVKANIVISVRGAKGGYLLANKPNKITVARIIRALEGPIGLTECTVSHQHCEQASGCQIQANWGLINQKIIITLESITLADMLTPVKTPTEVLIPVSQLYR